MEIKVHLLQTAEPVFVQPLQQALHVDVHLTFGNELPSPADFDILVAGVPEPEHLTASPNLHTLIIPWAGLPTKTRALLMERPHIAVHNLHHNAGTTAEMALTLMLAAAKGILPIDRTFREGDWSPRYAPSRASLLSGQTALILGYGAIGRHIATGCRGLGMNVLGVKRNAGESDDQTVKIHLPESLPELLPKAGVFFITMPHTPETRGMIGADELDLLPDGAVLVNIARGPIVDEAALYEELRRGRLRAGLDVWYQYPDSEAERKQTAPSAFPFDQLDNVVMTPHLAGHSDRTETIRAEALAELLNLAASGKPLPNRVDLARGY